MQAITVSAILASSNSEPLEIHVAIQSDMQPLQLQELAREIRALVDGKYAEHVQHSYITPVRELKEETNEVAS